MPGDMKSKPASPPEPEDQREVEPGDSEATGAGHDAISMFRERVISLIGGGRPAGLIGPRRALALVGLIVIVAASWYLRREGLADPALIERMIALYPVATPLVFVLLYAVAVTTALPTLPFNLAAGFFWGAAIGGILSSFAATLGAIVAFALARFLLGQPMAKRFDNRMLAAIQSELEFKGWRLVAFLRLNPIFPTGPLNYLLGLTAIPFGTYSWATFVFLLVPSWAVALVGQQLGTFVVQGEASDAVRTIVLVSAAVGVLVGSKYAIVLLKGAKR